MARTRAQKNGHSDNQATPKAQRSSQDTQFKGHTKVPAKKRQREDSDGDEATQDEKSAKDERSPTSKKPKSVKSPHAEDGQKATGVDKAKLNAIMEAYGGLTLSDSGLIDAKQSTPETILALVFMAMLTSARISHELAYKSQERTEVLTEGGYTRYREKTATALGDLAEFVETKYGLSTHKSDDDAEGGSTDGVVDSDLNNLLKRAASSPAKIRSLLQEIKGIGKVGTDIFCDAAQAAWPCLAPFIDPRSMETARQCGLGSDVGKIWEAVGHDAVEMCKLSSALTMVRLEKKEGDFK